MTKLRHREVKKLAQGPIASKRSSWNENPASWLQKLLSSLQRDFKYFCSFLFLLHSSLLPPLSPSIKFPFPFLIHSVSCIPIVDWLTVCPLSSTTWLPISHLVYRSRVRPWVIYPSSPLLQALLGEMPLLRMVAPQIHASLLSRPFNITHDPFTFH